MAEPETSEETPKAKRSKLPLILGVLGAILLGAGGFYATYSGLVGGAAGKAEAKAVPSESAGLAFVPIQPLVVSLGPEARARHLRFTAQMEVPKEMEVEVAHLMPRILDVLNGYLRAVEAAEFEQPAALIRMRAQMLRRVQIVTGEGRVRDLLITEFVLN